MTPTPEDIALAEKLTECWWLNKEEAQAIIAAHTAPLRELAEIGRLACKIPVLEKDKYANQGALSDAWDAFGNAVDAYLAKQEESKP